MSAPTSPCTPRSTPLPPSQPSTPKAAVAMHFSDAVPSSIDTDRQPLSPSDCHTLKKIIDDVQCPSITEDEGEMGDGDNLTRERALSDESNQNPSLLVEEIDSDAGYEDETIYMEEPFDSGDESQEGYEDEDGSMDLSDGERVTEDDMATTDGDTIEDIMNLTARTVSPAPDQDLSGVCVHEQRIPGGNEQIRMRRASIEHILEEERLSQECSVAIEDDAEQFGNENWETENGDEPEDMQAGVNEVDETNALGDDEVNEVGLDTFDPYNRRASQQFSPRPLSRRVSEDTPRAPQLFVVNSDPRPTVVPTPSGKHLKFTRDANIPDTPFTKTLNYFRQYKGKENTPAKSRRNASLPQEIAEIALEAREEEEEEDLDKYREMDLAPMEPVMKNDRAGDLIMFSSPVTARTSVLDDSAIFNDAALQSFKISNDVYEDDDTPGLLPTIASLDLQKTTRNRSECKHLADKYEKHENTGKKPTEQDLSMTSSPNDKAIILYPQHPTFVNVIGMLPRAMFWVVAAPVLDPIGKGCEKILEKLRGLEI